MTKAQRDRADYCEPSASFACARFFPTVTYRFSPGSDNVSLEKFTAAQRLELTRLVPALR